MPIIEIATNFHFKEFESLPLKLLKLEHDTETQSLDLVSRYFKEASHYYYLCDNKPDSISSRLVDWDRVDEVDANHSILVFLPQAWLDLKVVLAELCRHEGGMISFATYYQFGSDSIDQETISLADFEVLHENGRLHFNRIYCLD
jgi:hypothetical protein